MSIALGLLLGLSFLFNLSIPLYLRRKKPRGLDLNAQDLLHDLTTRGSTILRIEVIDQTNLLLRSPRS